jgi:hypothetical protein
MSNNDKPKCVHRWKFLRRDVKPIKVSHWRCDLCGKRAEVKKGGRR